MPFINISSTRDPHMAEFTIENGVMRWVSNGRVPPEDIVRKTLSEGYFIDVSACDKARDEDLQNFLESYRANYTGPSDEERFEARAAFGAGHEMVNAITGHRWRT